MKSLRATKILHWTSIFIRTVLSFLFIFAGATKAYDPSEFAREIARYQLVPWTVSALGAIYLPWLEMLTGTLLLLKRFERGALLVVTVLLLVFSVALASAMVRGLNIDCGCFGRAVAATGTLTPLIRNLVLLTCAGVIWVNGQQPPRNEG